MWGWGDYEEQSPHWLALRKKEMNFNGVIIFPPLSLPSWTSTSLSLAGSLCSARACDSEDIRFLEKAEPYLCRIREGFPTWSEALG